jgi:UDP-glucose 4-epimerase
MTSVAAASRIRELLRWTPELDDLDAIVRDALAWERRLMNQGDGKFREAVSA